MTLTQRIYYEKNKEKERLWRKKSKAKLGSKALKEKSDWKKANPAKCRAWEAVKRLVPLKDACEICGGNQDLERHHKDYGKPLEVMTLCRICHNALELIEPSICTEQPETRYYKGKEPVIILKHHNINGKWLCKILNTGEIRELTIRHLYYLPKFREPLEFSLSQK
jgi:hypothetical protein